MQNLISLAMTRKGASAAQRFVSTANTNEAEMKLFGIMQWFYKADPTLEALDKSLLTDVVSASTSLQIEMQSLLLTVTDNVSLDIVRNKLVSETLAADVQQYLEQYGQGAEIDLIHTVGKRLEAAKTAVTPVGADTLVDLQDDSVLSADAVGSSGYWPWPIMDDNVRPPTGGDNIVLGATTGGSKTTMACNLAINHQVKTCDDKRPVVIMNNESSGKRYQSRLISVALGVSQQDALAMKTAGTVYPAYFEAICGDISSLQVHDIHGKPWGQVEALIERLQPKAVIYDLLPNTPGGSADRRDLEIEQLFIDFRQLAVIHDFVAIPVVQLGKDAQGEMYPKLTDVKDCRSGVATTADMAFYLGNDGVPGNEDQIGISTLKSKMIVPGGIKNISSLNAVLQLDAITGTYTQFNPPLSQGAVEPALVGNIIDNPIDVAPPVISEQEMFEELSELADEETPEQS